jgi:hypothetical protein|tara:strand:- start:2819 stop:4309 length:1491 start_codon:yes stop_codon:yes gene_type:complete
VQHNRRYIPHLRTALVLIGTGTAGAYHAGVVRALNEAGVKVDLVAGRGVGAVGAMFAAIDGSSGLWESGGVWRNAGVARLYRWRWTLRVVAWLASVALAVLVLPMVALAGAAVAYPVGYLFELVGVEVGAAIISAYAQLVERVFEPAAFPTFIPRLIVVAIVALLGLLFVDTLLSSVRRVPRRRARGDLWWRLLGTPLDVSAAVKWFSGGLWKVMSGSSRVAVPGDKDFGERYAELLRDNLGQPGFCELLIVAHDIDARRDISYALLADPHRESYLKDLPDSDNPDRLLEVVDLSTEPGRMAFDAFSSSLSLPLITEPRFVSHAPESAWRGETHRVSDRLASTSRLFDEVSRAGAEQVILVSAFPAAPGPHTLAVDRSDIRGRAGQYLLSSETAALQDALLNIGSKYQAIFDVRPMHNPVGPFDFSGCYDKESDRLINLDELVNRGYEDGRQQFVEAVVAASTELIDAPSGQQAYDTDSISERLAAHEYDVDEQAT